MRINFSLILLFLITFSLNGSGPGDSLKIELKQFDLPIYYPSTGIQYYQDGLISIIDSKFNRQKKTGKRIAFGSISMYYMPVQESKVKTKAYFLKNDKFPYPAEATTFTEDYNTIYFAKGSDFRGYNDANIKIYTSKIKLHKNLKSKLVGKTKELPFSSKNYSCVQPAVSSDGNLLIFASNMPGGKGGFDLYYSEYKNGHWQDPVNLGSAINTKENESFPFINSKGDLFFSSNGHKGFGEHDIYFSRLVKPLQWNSPINLGKPLNSEKDDIAFILQRKNESKGFIVSDRDIPGKHYRLFSLTISGISTLETKNAPVISVEEEDIDETPSDSIIQATLQKEIDQEAVDKEKMIKSETADTLKPEIPKQPKSQDIEPEVLFRVQITSSIKSKGSESVRISGESYQIYEYFHMGAYRQTIGKFRDVDEAVELALKCREQGFKQAFVAAFKGDKRITDPSVFKK